MRAADTVYLPAVKAEIIQACLHARNLLDRVEAPDRQRKEMSLAGKSLVLRLQPYSQFALGRVLRDMLLQQTLRVRASGKHLSGDLQAVFLVRERAAI